MCGRTSLFVPPDDLAERFDAMVPVDYERRYNIAPRQPLATLPNDRSETVSFQEWGLLPPWADDPADGPRPINARSETVGEKSMFKDAFADRRCFVLADGFYEWSGQRGSKEPYRVQREGAEPFAMAGIWNRHEFGGDRLETVTILTCEPNAVVEPIHNRMPVILEPATEREWLTGDGDRAHELCRPYGAGDLEAYRISTAVNNPEHDSPDVLLPADTGEQVGLDEFGA